MENFIRPENSKMLLIAPMEANYHALPIGRHVVRTAGRYFLKTAKTLLLTFRKKTVKLIHRFIK
jgi:hypothetical protein